MPDPIYQIQDALAGRYSIKRELGKGGMATVWLARDLRHDRFVALKVMRPDLASSVGAERFLHEIRATAQLRHPHILPVFGVRRPENGWSLNGLAQSLRAQKRLKEATAVEERFKKAWKSADVRVEG